jgi:hypothetical protein
MFAHHGGGAKPYLGRYLLDGQVGGFQQPLRATHTRVREPCRRRRAQLLAKARLRVLVLIAARRAMTGNGSWRERFCSIHVTNGVMAPGASDGGACSMNCACSPARAVCT